MNNLYSQRGIGLIEVLITTVVIAIGLLAVASMQGTFISSSGESRARTEAMALAEAKTEELRNAMTLSGFHGDFASSASDESTVGTVETYTRSWVVTSLTDPDRRQLSVKVTWGGGAADETINLVTQVAWANPGNAADFATDGNGLAGKAPSPNNDSSENDNTKFKSSEISETALSDGSGLSSYTDAEGDVYLLESITTDGAGNDLQGVIKFTGGVFNTFKGSVYVDGAPSSVYPVQVSDLGVCVFPIDNSSSGGTAADYICYQGGDCSQTSPNSNGCPGVTADYDDIHGGWYGKIGLTEASISFHNKRVCFGEDIAGSGVETNTTARLYVTRRQDASSQTIDSEGINQSFACHDFLVVSKSGPSYPCESIATTNGLTIASSSIERILGTVSGVEEPNVVLAENLSSCGTTYAYIVTGGISGSLASSVTVSLDGQGCVITAAGGVYSYSCDISSATSPVTLQALVEGGTVTPTSITISSTGTTSGQDLVTSMVTIPETSYTISGTLTGDSFIGLTLTISDGVVSGSCTPDLTAYTYECSITSSATSATISASHTSGTVTVTPASTAVALEGTSTITTGIINAQSAPPIGTDYTIVGNIVGGNPNKITVTISDGGSCTMIHAGSSYSYSCDVTSTNSTVTLYASTTQNRGTVSPPDGSTGNGIIVVDVSASSGGAVTVVTDFIGL